LKSGFACAGLLYTHFSKLVKSTTHQSTNNTGRADQQHQTRTKPTNTTRGQKRKGGETKHKKTHRREAGTEGQRTNKNKEEDSRRRPATAGQARRVRERQQGQEEEAAQAKEKGACSSIGVLRGDGSLKG